MKTKLTFLFVIALIFMELSVTSGQEFQFLKVDTNNFPTARGWFVARTKAGTTYANMLPEEFILTENSQPVKNLSVECVKVPYFPPVSIAFVLDASSSMNEIAAGKETKIDWVKYFAKTMLDTLKNTPGTSIQFIHFSSIVYKNSPWFTDWTDRTPLYTWIEQNEIVYAGATDFNPPFLASNGGIEVLKQMPYDIPRYLVFVTDGGPQRTWPTTTINKTIDYARENKVIIDVLSLTTEAHENLRLIAQETGGRTWSCYAKDDIKLMMRDLAGNDLQPKTICNLVWDSFLSCDESTRDRQIFAKFIKIPDSTTTSFKAPYPPNISSSATQLMFGIKGVGTTQQQLTLTAKGYDFTINEINISPVKSAFTLDLGGKTLPLTIQRDKSQIIKINYVEAAPGTPRISTMSFTGTPCSLPEISLISPCGGIAVAKVDCGQTLQAGKNTTFPCVFKNTTPIQISGTAAIEGTDKADFSLLQGSSFNLGPNECVDMRVNFKPSAEGIKNATIKITLPTECGIMTVPLTGEGVKVGVDDELQQPDLAIIGNRPNPFTDFTEIDFSSNGTMPVSLSVYNTLGVKLETIAENFVNNGLCRAVWNSVNYPTGVYIIKLQSGNHSVVKTIYLVR